MNRFPSTAALAALLWCAGASAGWATSAEEERLLGCGCEEARLRESMPFSRAYSASGVIGGRTRHSPSAMTRKPRERATHSLDRVSIRPARSPQTGA